MNDNNCDVKHTCCSLWGDCLYVLTHCVVDYLSKYIHICVCVRLRQAKIFYLKCNK